MHSLRGRLVAILLVVALGGMVVLAAVTFAEQRSFLYDKLDRQVQNGFISVVGGLRLAHASGSANCAQVGPGSDGGGPSGRSGSGGLGLEDELPGHIDGDGDNGASREPFGVPPGTYGAIVDATGNVSVDCLFGSPSSTEYALPHFGGVTLTRNPKTVQSTGSNETEFRAAAQALPGSGGYRVVVAIPLTDTKQTIDRLVLVESVVIALVLALLGVSSWLLVGIGLRPLDKMGRTADAIAEGDLSHRVEPADQRSEIGRLGLALNRMLHRLEQAFAERHASERRLRQFLADASHELRTPLVSIRGYAELYRLGVTPDEGEVRRSMERIEQEAARMGVLVEDMLSLARLDETHDKTYGPVDFAQVAAGAVRDAEVAAPDRAIILNSDGEQMVIGDADQLQQVLANLLRNAIVHTPEGSPIDLDIARSGDDIRLDVRDHGPGLPDGAGTQIFERFWRAEGGRERGKAGSGLGLAIVSEIVTAHGGRVHAKNAEQGNGAVFSVWLPVADLSQLSA